MYSLVEKGDLFLVITTQKISHKFQKSLGLHCFWLGQQCVIIALLFATEFYVTQSNVSHRLVDKFILSGVELFFFYLIWILYQFGHSLEEKYFLNNLKRIVNDNVHTFFIFRIILLSSFFVCVMMVCFVPLATKQDNMPGAVSLVVATGLIVVSLYFFSSTPLPPAQSRLRKWLKGFNPKKLAFSIVKK